MDCARDDSDGICWFCKKGRHAECMVEIPTAGGSGDGGPHDCTFDTIMTKCRCRH